MEFYIENLGEVQKIFKALAMADATDKAKLMTLVKTPISQMENLSKHNLTSQRSVKTGNLLSSLRTRSHSNPYGVSAYFESNSIYNSPIDNGTGDRFTSAGKWTGAVGRATTNYKGRNYSFKLGFDTKAIKTIEPTVEPFIVSGLNAIINDIIERNSL